jgi:Putative, 10TM heavy-metal exporter
MSEYVETYGDPLVDAFLKVGVLVALMLALTAWARTRWGYSWDRWLIRYPTAGPLLAAALSIPPGCSGVIASVALYGQRQVTYGTVVSALLATMGDSAWVLLAADHVLAVELKALFFVVGASGGYAVDALHIEPRAKELSAGGANDYVLCGAITTLRRSNGIMGEQSGVETANRVADSSAGLPMDLQPNPPVSGPSQQWWEIAEPCCIDASLALPERPRRDGGVMVLLWSMIVLGCLVLLPVESNLVDEDGFAEIFGVSSYMALGLAGFLVASAVAIVGRKNASQCHCAHERSRAMMFRHGGYQTAKMVSLVGLMSLAVVVLTESTGFEAADGLPLNGFAGVILAALLGLLPSCGLEVVMATLFVAGGMPLPALLAYLISHDGAGLLTLFAVHRRSAIISTVLTTLPALAIGFAALTLS